MDGGQRASVRPEPRGKAKGVVVRPMVEWFASEFGTVGLDEVARTIDPRWLVELDRQRPAFGLVPGGWYDEELASELATRILAIASRRMTEAEALRGIGKVTVERSLGRISRAVIEWFVSPQAAAVSAQLSWRLHHSNGWITASVAGTQLHAVTTWGPHSVAWCAVVVASAGHVLELTGIRDVAIIRHRCSGGGPPCEATLGWAE